MSWGIKFIATRENAVKLVQADACLPDKLKAALVETIESSDSSTDLVRVEGFGHQHYGTDYGISSIGKLEVEPIKSAIPPVPSPALSGA